MILYIHTTRKMLGMWSVRLMCVRVLLFFACGFVLQLEVFRVRFARFVRPTALNRFCPVRA